MIPAKLRFTSSSRSRSSVCSTQDFPSTCPPALPELGEPRLHVVDQEAPVDPRRRLLGIGHARKFRPRRQRDLFEIVGNRGIDPEAGLG